VSLRPEPARGAVEAYLACTVTVDGYVYGRGATRHAKCVISGYGGVCCAAWRLRLAWFRRRMLTRR
jgi:hypothetical protein